MTLQTVSAEMAFELAEEMNLGCISKDRCDFSINI